jgi:hypothetical protein
VQQQVGFDGYSEAADDLIKAWRRHSKPESPGLAGTGIEPTPDFAWKYSRGTSLPSLTVETNSLSDIAYFERSIDSRFDVLSQQEFEQQLQTHLEGMCDNTHPTWYAIRNTVFASGCRLFHSQQHSANFTAVQVEAWGYFANALSVHSELLLQGPSSKAIRALLIMVSPASRIAQ